MRTLVLLLTTLFVASAAPMDAEARAPGGRSAEAAMQRHGVTRLEVGQDSAGEVRTAMVHVPRDYDASRAYPVVFAFHGGKGTNARQMMPNWADRFDGEYILVFPNGQLQDRAHGAWYADRGDDHRHVDVVRRMVEELDHRYTIDRDRIYATGFSSGGHMVWQLACEAPELFAGFAPVAAYLLEDYAADCDPDVIRPMLVVGSVDDPKQPYAGHPGHNLGAERAMEAWGRVAGCREDEASDDEGLTTGRGRRMRWDRCAAPVEHVRLEGVGHEWPGGPRRGRSGEPDGTSMILDFFERSGGR